MSILNKEVIDLISVMDDRYVVLRVSDHLDWDDINEHLFLLQEKVNTYIEFIESGELYEVKENYKNKAPLICISQKYSPPEDADFFFVELEKILKGIGVGLQCELVE